MAPSRSKNRIPWIPSRPRPHPAKLRLGSCLRLGALPPVTCGSGSLLPQRLAVHVGKVQAERKSMRSPFHKLEDKDDFHDYREGQARPVVLLEMPVLPRVGCQRQPPLLPGRGGGGEVFGCWRCGALARGRWKLFLSCVSFSQTLDSFGTQALYTPGVACRRAACFL